MSLNVETVFSEAPEDRLTELRAFFESLKLPDGRRLNVGFGVARNTVMSQR